MAAATYRIEDEPSPGRLSHLAVQPLWPLLCMMLGGFLIGMAWFAVNAIAVGSPTRVRECLLALGGVVGALLIGGAWVVAMDTGYLPGDAAAQYALLPMLVWKLGIGYAIFMMQNRSIQLYEYFGGVLRNGVVLVVACAVLRGKIIALVPNLLWAVVAS